MLIFKANKRFIPSLLSLKFRYGELTYTNSIESQSEFTKIPTFRLIDLDGKLISKPTSAEPAYLGKIL